MRSFFAKFHSTRSAAKYTESTATWSYSFSDRLASKDPSLCFTARIHATCRRHPEAAQTAAPYTAARHVRDIVDETTRTCNVLRLDAAEQDVAIALNAQLPLHQDGVEVLDAQIRLTLDDVTHQAALEAEQLRQEYVRKSERLRHEYELDELARRQARARTSFLHDEILANPASARLYTLLESTTDHWHRLGGPPAGTNLTDLVGEVQQWHPQAQWVQVAQLLHKLVANLTEAGSNELLTILVSTIDVYGYPELARQLSENAKPRNNSSKTGRSTTETQEETSPQDSEQELP